jgi:Tfp pilus assembly PilM family ATPase
MGFSMFASQAKPIAIDFGLTAVKLLQIVSGERPTVIAAAEVPIPDILRSDPAGLFTFYADQIPKAMRKAKFKGRRAVIAIPAAQTHIQHMQLAFVEGVNKDDLIKTQLQAQTGCSPHGVVVRSLVVKDVHKDAQVCSEVICFAIARDTVMRYVELLKKFKLNTVGVHTETIAMVRAFDHLNRRESDVDVTTLYVDVGWGGTNVAIAHGKEIVFSRYIQMGGRHFDQLIASTLHCDIETARAHRLSMQGPIARSRATSASTGGDAGAALLNVADAAHASAKRGNGERASGTVTEVDRRIGAVPTELAQELQPGDGPTTVANVDMTELLDTIADELSMCLRYHHGLFPSCSIDRAIFLGGEARQAWMCQHIVKKLRLPAQLGDPIARMSRDGTPPTPGVKLGQPQPGWAVACGLCTAPTDL